MWKLLLVALFLFASVSGQNIYPPKDTSSNIGNKKLSSTLVKSNKIVNDTLFHNGRVIVESNNDNNTFEKIFPSLIAVLISIIAIIGNYLISNRQLINSQKQFEIQIVSSEKTLKEQIDASKHSSDLIFRQNVLSVNRQNWINDFRDVISEISASIILVATQNYPSEKVGRILTLLTKIELMLNPNDPRDKDLISKVRNYKSLFLSPDNLDNVIVKLEEIISLSKVILKSEWERVKKGE